MQDNERTRPLSPWAYLGYEILFAIPVVGWICLIVCALSQGNINRRNFARSYFCIYLIVILAVVLFSLFTLPCAVRW